MRPKRRKAAGEITRVGDDFAADAKRFSNRFRNCLAQTLDIISGGYYLIACSTNHERSMQITEGHYSRLVPPKPIPEALATMTRQTRVGARSSEP